MEFAARNMKIKLPADHTVDAEIDLGPEGGAFSLAACRGWSARRRSALSLFASTVTCRRNDAGLKAASMRADSDPLMSLRGSILRK
jgi:hypothetical protein